MDLFLADIMSDKPIYGVDPMSCGEACYYNFADAISAANSLIELDGFYKVLMNTQVNTTDDGKIVTPVWSYVGIGVASSSKSTYVAVDYVDEI